MKIVRNKKAVVLRLKNPARVTTVIPSAVQVDEHTVAIPHRPDETRVLRNLGFRVPEPMPLHYSWPPVMGRHLPFEAQTTTASFLTMNSRAFCLNDMGTGKTNATLWAYDYLRRCKSIRRMVVVCPLSTMERTWADAVFNTFPHLNAVVLHGSRERRLKLLAEERDVYIVNHDGLKIIASALAKRADIDLIVVDELALARNAGTDRWKALDAVCNKQHPRRVWGLTGSPTPNSPTDAWAQCRLVTPDNPDVPRYFGRFKDATMRQVSPFKWVPRHNANETVLRAMQPSIRFSLDDCVDLPEQILLEREVAMTGDQARLYKEMSTRLKTQIAGGEVIAVNEAVKASKLVQIACGVTYGISGEELDVPNGPRVLEVADIIAQSEGKVIVFIPFTGALNSVAAELSKNFSVRIVQGSTSKSERDQTFSDFQRTDDPRVIVANPATMSHGLTLTAATTIIWFAPTWSMETYQQACARVRRPGQTKKTVIVHIAGTDIERKIYKRLAAKESMQGILLGMVEEQDAQEA